VILGASRIKAFQDWLHPRQSKFSIRWDASARTKRADPFGAKAWRATGSRPVSFVTYGRKGRSITFAATRHVRWI